VTPSRTLKLERIECDGKIVQSHYSAHLRVAGHGDVNIIVIPLQDEAVSPNEFVALAQSRIKSVLSSQLGIVRSGIEQINALCRRRFSDTNPSFTSSYFRKNFKLTHVKVPPDSIELIYHAPPLYDSLDVNLLLTTDLQVEEAWFDG
jgi:hypothetical protein